MPFVSKATAVQLAKAAARIAVGESIADLRRAGVLPASGDGTDLPEDAPIAVKEAVLPFHRFRTVEGHGVDTVLGPEMKSTGEVMGLDTEFGTAFAKSQAAAYGSLPTEGTVFVSLANRDKRIGDLPGQAAGRPGLPGAGDRPAPRRCCGATASTARWSASTARARATCVERILAGDVDIVVNTPFGSPGNSGPRLDGYEIRTAAVAAGIPCITTVQGMAAAVQGIEALRRGDIGVRSLQEVHAALTDGRVTAASIDADRAGSAGRAPAGAAGGRGGRPAPGRTPTSSCALAAPEIAATRRPRSVRRLRDRRRDLRPAAAPLDRDRRHRRTASVTRGRRRRTGRARRGCRGCSPGDIVDVVGPLGRPFPMPAPGTPALLVGGGYGAAALVGLAERLRATGSPVTAIAGAAVGRPAVLGRGAGRGRRRGRGHHRRRQLRTPRLGRPSPPTNWSGDVGVVYACGPMGDAARGRRAGHRGRRAVLRRRRGVDGLRDRRLHDLRAAGVGEDGRTRFSRSCVEGPVFGGDRVRFADVGTLPWDVVGADAMGVVAP